MIKWVEFVWTRQLIIFMWSWFGLIDSLLFILGVHGEKVYNVPVLTNYISRFWRLPLAKRIHQKNYISRFVSHIPFGEATQQMPNQEKLKLIMNFFIHFVTCQKTLLRDFLVFLKPDQHVLSSSHWCLLLHHRKRNVGDLFQVRNYVIRLCHNVMKYTWYH